MEIGVVDHEARLQLRRRRSGHHLEEVDQREETEISAGSESVAQTLSVPELGRRTACPMNERSPRRSGPDDLPPDPREDSGALNWR